MAMGRMAKLRCGARACPMDCCVMMEALVEDKWGFGDYFRAIDGYVAIEQTRVVAHTKEVHNVTDGDELYVCGWSARALSGTGQVRRYRVRTQKRPLPSFWLYSFGCNRANEI